MRITLIRHTKTNVKEGICYGQSDVGLNDSFEEDKKRVAIKIKGSTYDQVYSSPLKRCKKLAEFLFSEHTIIFDAKLKEMNFGSWEGISWTKIQESVEGKAWFQDYFNCSCPKGESYQDLLARIKSFYSELLKKQENDIVILAHGGTIKALISLIKQIPIEKAFHVKIDFGEVISLELK